MKSADVLLLSGKPGSGKSTLAKEFVSSFPTGTAVHLSMGDHMRMIARGELPSSYSEVLRPDTAILTKPKQFDPSVFNGVFEEFMTNTTAAVVLVDGFPRYPERVPAFYESASKVGSSVLGICQVDVPDSVARPRIAARGQRIPDMPLTDEYIDWRLADYAERGAETFDIFAERLPSVVVDGQVEASVAVQSLMTVRCK